VICYIKGRAYIEGIREQGAEENIWTQEEEVAGSWIRLHREELH
jgi:hypothetical protein